MGETQFLFWYSFSFAFVLFSTEEEVKLAVDTKQGSILAGQTLSLDVTGPKRRKSRGAGL